MIGTGESHILRTGGNFSRLSGSVRKPKITGHPFSAGRITEEDVDPRSALCLLRRDGPGLDSTYEQDCCRYDKNEPVTSSVAMKSIHYVWLALRAFSTSGTLYYCCCRRSAAVLRSRDFISGWLPFWVLINLFHFRVLVYSGSTAVQYQVGLVL